MKSAFEVKALFTLDGVERGAMNLRSNDSDQRGLALQVCLERFEKLNDLGAEGNKGSHASTIGLILSKLRTPYAEVIPNR